MAAWALTQAGAKVLMLEAGRDYDPVAETPMFNLPAEAPLFGESTPDKPEGYYDATVGGGWDVPGEPFTVAPGSRLRWWRARMLGGRTNHWGRLSLRFGPYDFKGRSRDGLGADWPISYEDLAPWYDKVEGLIGVFGAAEGIENSPDSPAGLLQPPPAMRGYEHYLSGTLKRSHAVSVVPAHMAILTQPLGDRSACVYASDCQRGCSLTANFQSPTVLISPARATGLLELRTNAHVFEVTTNAKGRADGVLYIDKATGRPQRASARAVVLGASTFETARILLNSTSAAFPHGLANGSGQVGRNLTDTIKVGMTAQVPALESLPPWNDEGVSLYHVYAPWWDYPSQHKGRLDFTRGYHLEFWGGRLQPGVRDMADLARRSGKWGAALHSDMARLYGSVVYMSASGEMLPNADTYCELDPDVKDRWGLPVLRFHWRHGVHDLATATHQRRMLTEAFEAMDAKPDVAPETPIGEVIRAGGSVNHEAGSARMGDDPAQSVLNANSRAWDVSNLYVVDAAAFASNPDKNPTLTILALAWRAADHLASALKRGDL
jgi:choline dehydrogenase-like flavoprotein